MTETGAVARIGIGLRPRIELDFSRDGHHQNITQIGMPRATKMGMTETYDGAVFVLIACAIFIHSRLINPIDVVRHGVGVGTELHDAKRRACPWEGMPHAVRPDDGIDVLDVIDLVATISILADGRLFIAAQYHKEGKKIKESFHCVSVFSIRKDRENAIFWANRCFFLSFAV